MPANCLGLGFRVWVVGCRVRAQTFLILKVLLIYPKIPYSPLEALLGSPHPGFRCLGLRAYGPSKGRYRDFHVSFTAAGVRGFRGSGGLGLRHLDQSEVMTG